MLLKYLMSAGKDHFFCHWLRYLTQLARQLWQSEWFVNAKCGTWKKHLLRKQTASATRTFLRTILWKCLCYAIMLRYVGSQYAGPICFNNCREIFRPFTNISDTLCIRIKIKYCVVHFFLVISVGLSGARSISLFFRFFMRKVCPRLKWHSVAREWPFFLSFYLSHSFTDVYMLLCSQVTILINNAGIVTGMKFLDTPDKLIIRTMDVNVMSHFWVSGKLFLAPRRIIYIVADITWMTSRLSVGSVASHRENLTRARRKLRHGRDGCAKRGLARVLSLSLVDFARRTPCFETTPRGRDMRATETPFGGAAVPRIRELELSRLRLTGSRPISSGRIGGERHSISLLPFVAVGQVQEPVR